MPGPINCFFRIGCDFLLTAHRCNLGRKCENPGIACRCLCMRTFSESLFVKTKIRDYVLSSKIEDQGWGYSFTHPTDPRGSGKGGWNHKQDPPGIFRGHRISSCIQDRSCRTIRGCDDPGEAEFKPSAHCSAGNYRGWGAAGISTSKRC